MFCLLNLTFLHFHWQPYDKARNALALALSPVVRALVDPDGAMRDIRDLDSVGSSSHVYCSLIAQDLMSVFLGEENHVFCIYC